MQSLTLLAQSFLNPGTLALMIPIVAIVGSMTVGVIKYMADHQRKMAELMRAPQQNDAVVQQLAAEVRALREAVASMNDKVNQSVLAADQNKPIIRNPDDEVRA